MGGKNNVLLDTVRNCLNSKLIVMCKKSSLCLLVLGLVSVLSSCKSKTKEDVMDIKVSVSGDNTVSIHSLNLIQAIDIVPLLSDDDFVGNIDKIVSCDTLLYLMDRDNQMVWVYDVHGQHISTINKKGHGADEYVQLTDIFIDKENETLNLLSRTEKKLLLFDLSGKNFLGQKKLPKTFTSMTKVPGGYVGYMGNYSEDERQSDNLWVLNDRLEILGSGDPIDTKLESRHRTDMRPLSNYKDKCHCINQMKRDVLLADDINIQKFCQFDFGNMNLPELTEEDVNDPRRMFEFSNSYIMGFDYFQETDEHLIALCLYQGQEVLIVYDKNSQEAKLATLDVDEKEYLLGFGYVRGMDEQHIYTVQSPDVVYSVYEGGNQYNNFEETHPKQVANLRRKLGDLQKNDNPFIMIYSIK